MTGRTVARDSEATLVVIKPEEVESGRAQQIHSFVEEFCRQNNLQVEARRMVLDSQTLERHYFGKGEAELIRIGDKVQKMLRVDDPSISVDSRTLGEDVMRAHLRGYTGREAVIIRITGQDAVSKINSIKGNTDSAKAPPDTIRGRFSGGLPPIMEFITKGLPVRNVVHVPETKDEAVFDLQTFWR